MQYNIYDFFKRRMTLILAIVLFADFTVNVLCSVFNSNTPIYITSIIQLPLQVITLLSATAFLLLFLYSRQKRKLTFPTRILIYTQTVYVIYYLLLLLALFVYKLIYRGLNTIDDSVIVATVVMIVIIIVAQLIQLTFYFSIKKSIANINNFTRGAKATSVINYLSAVLMFFISLGRIINVVSIILILVTVSSLVVKGYFADSYYKEFK